MAESAALLVDAVLPHQPMRQWVLSVPFPGTPGLAGTEGLLWKIWTENPSEGIGGGIYLFTDDTSARAYLDKHLERLEVFGYSDVRAKIFNVNQPLSQITKAQLQQP